MKRRQKILILGLGGVGRYLAMQLANEGHAITVIESDAEALRSADVEIDARLIHGDAMTSSCWLEAAAPRMDCLIAVTNNDAVNVLASMIGDRFGIRRKIARVRSHGLWSNGAVLTPEELKIDLVIQPEELAAQEVAKLLKMRWGNSVIDPRRRGRCRSSALESARTRSWQTSRSGRSPSISRASNSVSSRSPAR